MFHNYPHFYSPGLHSIIQVEIPIEIPAELNDLLKDVLKAVQLISVLRSLHLPVTNESLDEEIESTIRIRISKLFLSAASKTDHIDFKRILIERSKSFQDQDYITPAYNSSIIEELPVEILIGNLPSWRYIGKPKTYSALIALPDFSQNKIIKKADEEASEQAKEINNNFEKNIFESISLLPTQITCDIIALGGDFAAQPIHIAHFLPEDEGHYNSSTYKTLIYRNIYLLRYKEISIPLSNEFYIPHILNQPKKENDLWAILSIWFRGHDIGHSYFDPLLKKLPGIKRRKRYAFQETMADLFGYFLAIRVLYKKASENININVVTSVYVTEMIRYMTRDSELFPDSKAAWFQFGYLIKVKAVQINSDGKADITLSQIPEKLTELMYYLIQKTLSKETAFLESFLEDYSTFYKDQISLDFFKTISTKEVNPVFTSADRLLTNSIHLKPEHSIRSQNKQEDFDGRRRF